MAPWKRKGKGREQGRVTRIDRCQGKPWPESGLQEKGGNAEGRKKGPIVKPGGHPRERWGVSPGKTPFIEGIIKGEPGIGGKGTPLEKKRKGRFSAFKDR